MVKKRSTGRGKETRTDEEEQLPDAGTAWLKAGRSNSTIVLDHFDLHMLGRAGESDYTSSRTYVAESAYMLTLEFDEERFQELLRLLPKPGAAQIARALGGSFSTPKIINIPPGAIVVGIRGRLGDPRTNSTESYVPIVVTSLFKPGPIMSVSFEESRAEGVLEVIHGPSGPTHGYAGRAIRDGDAIDVWLKQENNWVSGRYQANRTSDGTLETKFAMLLTERTGGRPIFLGYKVRRAE